MNERPRFGRVWNFLAVSFEVVLVACTTVQVGLTPGDVMLAFGDVAIICSDGLHSMINDDAIQAIMVAHEKKPLADGCQALINAALEAGGKDNVSVILLRYTE